MSEEDELLAQFDREVRINLGSYNSYLQEWMPIFANNKEAYIENVLNFFPEKRKEEEEEEDPFVVIEGLMKFKNYFEDELIVSLYLNEKKEEYFEILENNIDNTNPSKKHIKIHFYSDLPTHSKTSRSGFAGQHPY